MVQTRRSGRSSQQPGGRQAPPPSGKNATPAWVAGLPASSDPQPRRNPGRSCKTDDSIVPPPPRANQLRPTRRRCARGSTGPSIRKKRARATPEASEVGWMHKAEESSHSDDEEEHALWEAEPTPAEGAIELNPPTPLAGLMRKGARERPQQGLLALDDELLLLVALGRSGVMELPPSKNAKKMLQFLSCCQTMWSLQLPVAVKSQYHTRWHGQASFGARGRFAIRAAEAVGDAFSRPELGMLVSAGHQLRSLSLSYCRLLDSLSPLAQCPIENLRLHECHKLTDLSPLAGCQRLQALEIEACLRLTDLKPLSSVPLLHHLELKDQAFLTDVTGLHFLKSLQVEACHQIDWVTGLESLDKTSSLNLLELSPGFMRAVVDSTAVKPAIKLGSNLHQRVKLQYTVAIGFEVPLGGDKKRGRD